MTALARDNVDYRLVNNLSKLVICSHCLRNGKVTPVPQIITKRRRLTNLCSQCRRADAPKGLRSTIGKLLHFPARRRSEKA